MRAKTLRHVLRSETRVIGGDGLVHYQHIYKGLWCSPLTEYILKNQLDVTRRSVTCLWCLTGVTAYPR